MYLCQNFIMKNVSYLISLLLLLVLISACSHAKKTTVNKKPTSNNKPAKPSSKLPPTPKEAKLPSVIKITLDNDSIVKKTQILLFLHGYKPGKITGELNQSTIDALQQFQTENKLPVGDLSEQTLIPLGIQRLDFAVSDLQKNLEQKGYDPGAIDNLMGNMTRNAYVEFLTQNHFSDKGGLTAEIKNALFSTEEKYKNKQTPDILFNEINNNSSSSTPNLAGLDAKNIDIKLVQQALQYKGYEIIIANGILNPATEDAILRFQIDNKLPLGGLNDDTLKALGFK